MGFTGPKKAMEDDELIQTNSIRAGSLYHLQESFLYVLVARPHSNLFSGQQSKRLINKLSEFERLVHHVASVISLDFRSFLMLPLRDTEVYQQRCGIHNRTVRTFLKIVRLWVNIAISRRSFMAALVRLAEPSRQAFVTSDSSNKKIFGM